MTDPGVAPPVLSVALNRYCILGIAEPDGVGAEDQWLQYPLTHYAFEAGQARIDQLNNEVLDAEERGRCYPFIRYELVPVSDALVGQWDERTT